MWPFKRRVTTIVLRHEGLEDLADAIRYAAKVQAGMIHAKAPPPPPEEKRPTHKMDGTFDLWVSNQGFSDAQVSHLRACWQILTGKRECPAGFSRDAVRLTLAESGAPLPS